MIELKSAEQIEKIRNASRILINVINSLKLKVRPGTKTKELNILAKALIEKAKARPAFLNYKGFPASICTCVNEEVVHSIPGERILKDGDILSIDVGVEKDGYFSDAAVTVAVGKISPKALKLIETSRQALYKAIDLIKPGSRISDISFAIQDYAESMGFSVIREFVGHGIGSSLHEDPQIPNFGQPGMGVVLKEGMVLALEPMLTAGEWKIQILDDGWTAVTADKSLAAHFEHTVAVTSDGAEVLTEGI